MPRTGAECEEEEKKIRELIDPMSMVVATQRKHAGMQIEDLLHLRTYIDWKNEEYGGVDYTSLVEIEPWRLREIVELLLKAGVDPLVRDKKGCTRLRLLPSSKARSFLETRGWNGSSVPSARGRLEIQKS
jgi:hypothetical protein